MKVALIILAVLLALAVFTIVELWQTAKELKHELEFYYGEHQSNN